MSAAVDAVLRAVARLAGEPADALEAIALDGALSAPMARWALRTTTARYTPDALARCASARDLRDRDVAVLLAESVPTAPLRALALPLLRGARSVTARASRHQPHFAALVARTLADAGLPVALDPAPDARAYLAQRVARGVHVVLAYGADETLDAIRAGLDRGVRFEGRGHGFGVSVVARECADDPRALDAVARDVVHYDQRGCLSPQCVLLEGGDPVAFAARLHEALARVGAELPRGPLDAGLAAGVLQWQGALAASAAAFHRGADHAVAALEAPRVHGSPGARNVAVAPVADPDALRALLAPYGHVLTCVGLAAPPERRADFALPGTPARWVAAGAMQDPPLDGYEDPRSPRA